MGAQYAVDKAADPGKVSLIGAAISGALGGLAADLAAGGLTFGAGALLGGLIGAAGARGLASAYNLVRGSDATTVRWSGEFMSGRVSAALLRYLAVAHFGRGRGTSLRASTRPTGSAGGGRGRVTPGSIRHAVVGRRGQRARRRAGVASACAAGGNDAGSARAAVPPRAAGFVTGAHA